MKLLGLDHIVFCVRDVKRTVAFYERALGMRPVEERPDKWSLHFGPHKISLQDVRTAPDMARGTLPGSGNVCILTETPVQELAGTLSKMGVEIIAGPAEREGATGKILSIYFRDPDGNLLELSNPLALESPKESP